MNIGQVLCSAADGINEIAASENSLGTPSQLVRLVKIFLQAIDQKVRTQLRSALHTATIPDYCESLQQQKNLEPEKTLRLVAFNEPESLPQVIADLRQFLEHRNIQILLANILYTVIREPGTERSTNTLNILVDEMEASKILVKGKYPLPLMAKTSWYTNFVKNLQDRLADHSVKPEIANRIIGIFDDVEIYRLWRAGS